MDFLAIALKVARVDFILLKKCWNCLRVDLAVIGWKKIQGRYSKYGSEGVISKELLMSNLSKI